MAKIQKNNNTTFSIWSSCRRTILNTLRCGTHHDHSHRRHTTTTTTTNTKNQPPPPTKQDPKPKKSEKLFELLKMCEMYEEEEEEVRKKVAVLEEMKMVVKRLQCGDSSGAHEVRRLCKDDHGGVRMNFGLLGVIPPLMAMVDDGGGEEKIVALYALLNLGIGNDENKAAIVKAGVVHKMLNLVQSPNGGLPDPDLSAAIVANFLGLSALDSNKPIIGSSGAISFLVKTLKNAAEGNINSQVVQDCLCALYNLSILPTNVAPMIEIDDFLLFLLTSLGDMEVSDRILSILSNVVSTPEGRKALSGFHDSFHILVDVLSWTDMPDCQEKATYILMVMAHKSYRDRQAMIESGVSSSLLELTLLGSTLAQKRASRILEILRIDKGKQVSETFVGSTNVSAPLYGSADSGSTHPLKDAQDDRMMSDESMAVKNLVQQSLHSNMRRIVKRANLPQDFVPSEHFRSLTSISTSKSLPF